MTTSTLSSGTTTGAVVSNTETLLVLSGAATVSTIVDYGGTEELSGGTASGTTVQAGGSQTIDSGGSATSTILESGSDTQAGGVQTIYAGGTATSTTVDTYAYQYLSGGTAIDTTLEEDSAQYIYSGTASGTTVSYADQLVYGGSAVSTVLIGGTQTVFSGAMASGTTISGDGAQNVYGVVSDTTLGVSGSQSIYVGGSATSTTVFAGGAQYDSGTAISTVLSGGSEFVYSGAVASGTTIDGGGVEYLGNGGVDNGATINYSGEQDVYGSASGTVINSGGIQYVELGGAATSTTTNEGGVEYVYSSGTLSGADINSGGTLEVVTGATVTGVQLGYGGAVDLESFTFNSNYSASVSNGELTLSSGGSIVDQSVGVSSFADATFIVTSAADGTTLITEAVCYLRGTHILTPTGERLIEDVKIGDAVVTRFTGIQAIKWIGRQTYGAEEVRGERERIPVHLRPGSLGQNLPARDLYVSPGHSMLVGGTLVLAKSLVNGITITQDWVPEITDYFQLELDHHDCVVAEGTWSETFADGDGLRDRFHNVAEFHALFPDHRPPEELVPLCGPRPERGPALAAALGPVVALAGKGLSEGPVHGFIDMIGEWKVEGWAQDKAHPRLPVMLEVLVQDKVIGTVLACDFRTDLLEALGHGDLSFSFLSPIKLRPELQATLQVRRASDGAALTLSHRARAPQRISSASKQVPLPRVDGERVRLALVR